MRTAVLMLILLSFVLTISYVRADDFLVESVKSYSSYFGREYYTYKYNDDKQFLEEASFLWENNEWTKQRRYIHEYDQNGNIILRTCEVGEDNQWRGLWRFSVLNIEKYTTIIVWEDWEDGQWINDSRATYIDDELGNTITSVYEDWENGQWVYDSKYTYTYKNYVRLIQRLEQNWENGEWVNRHRDIYEFNENGDKLSWLDQYWKGNKWDSTNYKFYTYDERYRLIESQEAYWIEENKHIWREETYKYDTNDYLREYTYCYWSYYSYPQEYYKMKYDYDNNGNTLQEIKEIRSGNKWVPYNRYSYTYDGRNRLTRILKELASNDDWIDKELRLYTYNENNEPLTITIKTCNYYQWSNDRKYTYTYNDNGALLMYLYQVGDDDKWINEYRYSKSYDDNRNLILMTHEEWKDGNWVEYDFDSGFSDLFNNYFFFPMVNKVEIFWNNITSVDYKLANISTTSSPNPFSEYSVISYQLSVPGKVKIDVYNSLGTNISTLTDEYQDAGEYQQKFEAGNLPPGMYYYTISIDGHIQTGKMVLVR